MVTRAVQVSLKKNVKGRKSLKMSMCDGGGRGLHYRDVRTIL